MIKDILVDNNIAKNFKNPANPEYEKLIKWLFEEFNHDFIEQFSFYISINKGNSL